MGRVVVWPPVEQWLHLFATLGYSRKAVADHLGRHPEVVRAYLRRHAELNAKLSALKPPAQTAAERSRRHNERHSDRRKAQGRARYYANRESMAEVNRQWYESHREESRLRKRREFVADPDRVRARRNQWSERNREALRRRNQVQYVLRKGDKEAAEYGRILLGDPCVYCGRPAEHIDHIHPLSRGGSGSWDNLAATCASCNTSKQARSVLGFMFDRLN